jgi:hypothetical protein
LYLKVEEQVSIGAVIEEFLNSSVIERERHKSTIYTYETDGTMSLLGIEMAKEYKAINDELIKEADCFIDQQRELLIKANNLVLTSVDVQSMNDSYNDLQQYSKALADKCLDIWNKVFK